MEIKLPLASLKANSHTSGPHMSKILNNDTPASDSVEKFREKLRAAQHIIVVAGAGLSAASGMMYLSSCLWFLFLSFIVLFLLSCSFGYDG